MTGESVHDQKHEFASYGVRFLGPLEIHVCTPFYWKLSCIQCSSSAF